MVVSCYKTQVESRSSFVCVSMICGPKFDTSGNMYKSMHEWLYV